MLKSLFQFFCEKISFEIHTVIDLLLAKIEHETHPTSIVTLTDQYTLVLTPIVFELAFFPMMHQYHVLMISFL